MTKIVISCLVAEACRSLGMRPIQTPFGVKRAHVVYYNSMLAHGVQRDTAKDIMKEAATKKSPDPVTNHPFMTKGIMRDAIKGNRRNT